jgi:hypothetical protein
MNENYYCNFCRIEYKTYVGLWKHNKKYHFEEKTNNQKSTTYFCKYCNSQFSSRQSRWRHEQECSRITNKPLQEQIHELSNKINNITTNNITTNSNNNNNSNNNTTNNIQYIINSPITSSIDHLTFELQKDILDKGLNSLLYLIELVNFNKSVPENHSYCITAINDKHASVIDEKTNKVIKTNKFDLFDQVLGANLNNLEKISDNPKLTSTQKKEYKDKIKYLRENILVNNRFMKRYKNDINIISYNNKEMVKETWKSLKEFSKESKNEENEPECKEVETEYKVKGFDELSDELPDDEKPDFLKTTPKKRKPIITLRPSSSDSSDPSEEDSSDSSNVEPEYDEIKIKGKIYILEGYNMYIKTNKGTKGPLYGIYSNGTINKVSND